MNKRCGDFDRVNKVLYDCAIMRNHAVLNPHIHVNTIAYSTDTVHCSLYQDKRRPTSCRLVSALLSVHCGAHVLVIITEPNIAVQPISIVAKQLSPIIASTDKACPARHTKHAQQNRQSMPSRTDRACSADQAKHAQQSMPSWTDRACSADPAKHAQQDIQSMLSRPGKAWAAGGPPGTWK